MPRLPFRALPMVIAIALAAPLYARPPFPELPLGTASAACAGGGAAHAAGVASLFANPAALSVRDAFQAEAGAMGLTSGLSPYALFGAPAGERAAYALGYWYDARPGVPSAPLPPRAGLVAGVAWEAASWASIGGVLKSAGTGDGVGDDGFGVDADVGALLRIRKAAWLGLVLHDVMESGVGEDPNGFGTHRSYGLSLGTGRSGLRWAGIPFHEPDAEYELRAQGFSPDSRLTHAFSLASAFFPGGRLGFRATLALPQSGMEVGSPGFAWGTFLNLPLGDGVLVVSYAVQTGASGETGEKGLSHSASLNFRMGGRLDPVPPTVEITADRASLAPDDSVGLLFRLSAHDLAYVQGMDETPETEAKERWAGRQPTLAQGRTLAEGRIRAWTLTIRRVGDNGLAGPTVRVIIGQDLPPRAIRWDLGDDSGHKVSVGYYAFRLEAEDAAGNAAATVWQLVRIGPQSPDFQSPDSLSAP